MHIYAFIKTAISLHIMSHGLCSVISAYFYSVLYVIAFVYSLLFIFGVFHMYPASTDA